MSVCVCLCLCVHEREVEEVLKLHISYEHNEHKCKTVVQPHPCIYTYNPISLLGDRECYTYL